MKLTFTIPGKPTPKQRPRHGKGKTFTPTKTRKAEKAVAMLALTARPQGWPLEKGTLYGLEVVAHYKNRRYGDLDNVVKMVSDGCEGVLYPNDRQICEGAFRRVLGNEERTEVTVYTVEEQ